MFSIKILMFRLKYFLKTVFTNEGNKKLSGSVNKTTDSVVNNIRRHYNETI